MLAKWIVCRVAEASRPAFSEAQLAWAAGADCPGFLGQCGGFHDEYAHVVALWKDPGALQRFARHERDALAGSSQQRGFSSAVEVHVLSRLVEMPGQCDTLPEAVAEGRFARISDCSVHASRRSHFIDAHLRTWRPGLAGVAGLLCSTLWSFDSRPNRFLVVSLWDDEASHASYARQVMPDLRAQAATHQDIAHIESRAFSLVRRWTVSPALPAWAVACGPARGGAAAPGGSIPKG